MLVFGKSSSPGFTVAQLPDIDGTYAGKDEDDIAITLFVIGKTVLDEVEPDGDKEIKQVSFE